MWEPISQTVNFSVLVQVAKRLCNAQESHWRKIPIALVLMKHKMKLAHLLSSFALRNFSSRRAISSQIAAFSFKKNFEHNHIKCIKDQGLCLGGSIKPKKSVSG
jgi:hypothetical protein